MLSEFDGRSVAVQQAVSRDMVLERLEKQGLTRLPLFDCDFGYF
jgi:hypothetical protein